MYERDVNHLKLLSIFYYVWGGLQLVMTCFPLIYLALGATFLLNPEVIQDDELPDEMRTGFGALFTTIGAVGALITFVSSILSFVTARSLSVYRRRTFCFVIAGLSCVSVPLGTALGICTIIVLSRDSVRRMFEGQTQFGPGQPPPPGYAQPKRPSSPGGGAENSSPENFYRDQ